jgi:hypothetical protein
MVAVNWPVSESLQVWKPESDRGESRLGYQISGPPKGGPFCFGELPLYGLSPVAASDKSLRRCTIQCSPRWSLWALCTVANTESVNRASCTSVSSSQILTDARTTC